ILVTIQVRLVTVRVQNGAIYNRTPCTLRYPTHSLYASFFFNDTATTEIYTLSLHDALPISVGRVVGTEEDSKRTKQAKNLGSASKAISAPTETTRSEERFSRNAEPLFQIGRAVQQECRDRSRMPSSA